MNNNILIFLFVVVVYQVQSQICVGPGPLVASPQLIPTGPYLQAPQIVASPIVATTIVDNSVSNALANALQLLIVSDLIQSKLSNLNAPNALLNCLGPVLERVSPLCAPVVDVPCYPPLEVIPPCVPVIETISPCFGGITETITPNIFGGYTETFCANPYTVAESILPNCFCGCGRTDFAPTPCGIADIIAPNMAYGPNVATLTPNVYGGVTEVISTCPCGQPFPVNNLYGGFTEVINPGCCSNYYGLTEVVTPTPYIPNCYPSFPEVIAPVTSFNPCIGGISEIINPYGPNFYGGMADIVSPISPFNPGCITEVITPTCLPNYYGGLTEVISPISPCNTGCIGGLTEVIPPCFSPYYGGITEVITPMNPFNPGCISEVIAPNFFGVNEIIAPTGPYAPMAAEVLLPPAIPAQLTCNFGYMPTSVPCVSFNVETLPFEPCGCGCNGYPKGFYY